MSGRTAYEVRWKDSGKDRQRTFTVKRDANRFALRLEVALADGATTAGMVKLTKTVAEVVEASFAAAAPRLKPRTVDGYRRTYDLRVLPRFGSQRISAVTSEHVEVWIADMVGEGLAPATVHHQYMALAKVRKYAGRHRLITYNPCQGVDLPRVGNRDDFEPMFFRAADVERLAAVLDGHPPYGTLVRFAAYTDLRAAEITGLRVRDVNLAAGHVEVRQTLQLLNGVLVVGTPKSRRSVREVPLGGPQADGGTAAVPLDAPGLRRPDRAVLAQGSGVARGGPHRRARHRQLPAELLSARAGELQMPDMRFHDLRHTAASL